MAQNAAVAGLNDVPATSADRPLSAVAVSLASAGTDPPAALPQLEAASGRRVEALVAASEAAAARWLAPERHSGGMAAGGLGLAAAEAEACAMAAASR